MARRKMQKGICRICKKNTDLSFEHVPPKSAFNKYTKYRTVPYIEYIRTVDNEKLATQYKLQQGGIGYYCLCRNCNSFLGTNYVTEYFKMAQIGKKILQKPDFYEVLFKTDDISPLRFFKQVLSMFVCINNPEFTVKHPEILTFLKNPEYTILPDEYRIFMYLNNEGQIRNLTDIATNHYGYVNEITFPPFGFVLSLDPKYNFPLTEITFLKSYSPDYKGDVIYRLYRLPTHLPFPVDYRTKIEIDDTVKKTEEYLKHVNKVDN